RWSSRPAPSPSPAPAPTAGKVSPRSWPSARQASPATSAASLYSAGMQDGMPAAALIAGPREAVWVDAEGEIETLAHARPAKRAAATPPLVCHAPSVARRLGGAPFRAFDILTLYAFVRPARFCLPTPRGVAAALGLPLSDDPAQQALGLFQ